MQQIKDNESFHSLSYPDYGYVSFSSSSSFSTMASQNTLFRQQQQLYRSSHYFGKPKSPPLYVEQTDSYAGNDQQGKGKCRLTNLDKGFMQ